MYKTYTLKRYRPKGHLFKLLLIMKLTTVLLMITLLQVSAKGTAQQLTYQKKRISLEQLFQEIDRQTGYNVIYSDRQFNDQHKIDVSFKNTPLKEVLDYCLKNQALSYTIREKNIIIKEKTPGILERIIDRILNIDVSGRITDEQGNGIPGATIKVKNTPRTVISDSNGNFKLTSIPDESILTISFVGYKTREIPATANLGNITLEINAGELTEVSVVSTGYQNLPKERATGSFSKVDNETFNRQVSTDVISRLKGIAPSINFDERNASGNTYLSIRGRSTIFGNDQPLIVVDNFPFEGNLNNLNPNDIEDISILKDAAAASIWGIRAGNGVIVVTTKKGRLNKPMQVNLNSNVTVGERPDLFYEKRMAPTDFIDVETMLFEKGYFNTIINNTATGPSISPVVEILLQQRNNTITADQAKAQVDNLRQYDLRNDMIKYLFQNTVKQQYTLNVNGGGEKYTYYLSTGVDDNKLSARSHDFSRIVVNGNQTFRPIKNLEITTAISFNQNHTNNTPTVSLLTLGGGRSMYPYARLTDDNGNPLALTTEFRNSFKNNAVDLGYLNWDYVPLDELKLQDFQIKLNSTRLSSGINYKIIDGLSADIKFQYERQNSDNSRFRSEDSYYMRDLINKFTTRSGSVLTRNLPLGGSLETSFNSLTSLNGRGQVNYDKTWLRHQLTAIAGYEAREVRTNRNNGLAYGYDPLQGTSIGVNYAATFLRFPSGSSTIPYSQSIGGTVDRFRSYYTNASYTFLERYTLSGSGRIDQSNLFGVKANQRAVPLWSTGLKWNVMKEEFYNLGWLPMLAIRSSYGYNGNLDNTLTAFTTARLGTPNGFVARPAAILINPPNSNLRWERNRMWNIGVDFASARNRILGSIEYYNRKGKDLIGSGDIDPTAGFAQFKGNVANMIGNGVDVDLSTLNIVSKRFKWSTNYLFSYAVDKLKEYKLIPTVANFIADASLNRTTQTYSPVSGRPLFGVYSIKWAGLDPATGAPRGYLNGEPSTNYAAINSQISSSPISELVYHGPALAPYFGALRNTFNYYDFEVSFNITYRFGYYFRRLSMNYNSLYAGYYGHADYNDRWQKPGDELSTDVPALIYPANNTSDVFYARSEVLVTKGDHIRLQDATVAYSINKTQIRQLPFKEIKLFVYANNLGLLWIHNKQNIDPDFPSNKPIRTIAFGLNCSF